jgi:peptidoglycan-N-acetylglucosamine deacetylase
MVSKRLRKSHRSPFVSLRAGGAEFRWQCLPGHAKIPATMRLIPALLATPLLGPTIRRTDDPSAMALTFDDGPNPAITPKLLDLLERHGVRATFFLIGGHVRAFPSLAKEIAKRGHTIGNHTDSHPALTFLPPRRIAEELDRCDDALEAATGARPRWMRPPYGFRGPQLAGVVRRRGCAGVVMWSVWAWDWKPRDAAGVIRHLRRARGGDIVLLHDGDPCVPDADRRHTLAALEHWLPRWKDAGIGFATLDMMFKDS